MLDTTVNGAAAFFVIGVIFYAASPNDAARFFDALGQNRLLDVFLTIIAAMPLNVCLLALTGGTLGKWLFGISVRATDGQRIGTLTAVYREVLVWVKGMGLGVPLVTLFTCGVGCRTLVRTGATSWDKQLGTHVLYRPSGFRQGAGATLGVVVWLGTLGALNALDQQSRPRLATLPNAVVSLVNDRMVRVDGPFGRGTAEELRRVLDTTANVRFVELESNFGGLVDEGLAAYDIIRARHLDTFTQGTCVSACTMAYMAGGHRFLAEGATLQFHEWETAGVRADRDSEMARRLLVAAGIGPDFAARAFANHELWVPDRATLIAAGVVTHAMDGHSYR
jgi:hypothetical protein